MPASVTTKRLAAILLDVEDARHEDAGRTRDRAARLDQDPEAETAQGRKDRRRRTPRARAPLADSDAAADVEAFDGVARRGRESSASAREIPRRLCERPRHRRSGCRCAPAARSCGRWARRRARSKISCARPMSTPNLFCLQARRDVGMRPRVDVRVHAQRDARDHAPAARAIASICSISRWDSALKARILAATPAAISSSVLPTPEKTIRSAGIPHSGAARSSPPETTSAPDPSLARRPSRARLELAFVA